MKKLFFTLALLFALSFSASAQEGKVAPEALAKNELAALNDAVGLTSQQQTDLYRLFEQKYKTLADASLSNERKAEFSRVVDLKIQATLTGDQNQKLEANRKTFDKARTSLNSK